MEEQSTKPKDGELTKSINRCAVGNSLHRSEEEWAGVIKESHGNLFSNVTVSQCHDTHHARTAGTIRTATLLHGMRRYKQIQYCDNVHRDRDGGSRCF